MSKYVETGTGKQLYYVQNEFSDKHIKNNDWMALDWHRVGGPAFINDNGSCSWYVNDSAYMGVENYCNACGFDDETTLIWVMKYGERLPRVISEFFDE